MKNTRAEFKELSDREHVLLRPTMYLGGVDVTEKDLWLYNKDTEKFKFSTLSIHPALIKSFSELLDNSIDVAIDTGFATANNIQISVDATSITVVDNGIGILCAYPKNCATKDKIPQNTICCKCWTKLKAGTSFGDNQEKIGTNGVGSSVVNVFSKKFIGISDDGKHCQTIECSDNMSIIKASPIRKSKGTSGCKVTVFPDLQRFGLSEINESHISLMYQRVIDLSICYPKIQFTFNGKKIKVNTEDIGKFFSNNCLTSTSDNAVIGVFPNEYDEFRFYSVVNGISVSRGGAHIDNISTEICNRIRDKLVKKYKTIRPGDIKNKLSIFVFLTNFKNCKWDSQTKEMLSNSNSDIIKHLAGKIDFDAFVKTILKNESIIGPIIETFQIKEELKARSTLKQAKKFKIKSDKYFPGIGSKQRLFLTEGLSAGGGLLKCLGREGNYFYCLRGLALNVFDSTIQRIAANQEVKEVLNILNLDITKQDSAHKDVEFEKIVIACDADLDGINISSMLIGWFRRLAPNLYANHKIYKLITPVVILKDYNDKVKNWFFTLDEFKAWEKQTDNKSKLKILYLKGLGSLEISDLDYIISKVGFDSLLQELYLDDKSDKYIQDWLGDDSEPRKQYLREYDFDINLV